MIRLTVSPAEASRQLGRIPHAKCLAAIDRHWVTTRDDFVTAQSACWLYCWAKTGLNSPNAAQVADEVFGSILDVSYEHFDARVPHEWAREARYSRGDIEADLEAYLK